VEIALTDVEFSGRQTFELHHLTDVHLDDPDHAAEYFQERVEHIRSTPNALWLGGGDYGSLIVPGDKRFGSGGHIQKEWAEHLSRLPDFYLERCDEVFSPIADKCVGLVAGNHEATIGKNYHRGLVPELAMRLGRPDLYLGDRGWSVVRFNMGKVQIPLRVYAYHGWSSGRLKGRKQIQAERDLGSWQADVFMLGHDHQPAAHIWYSQECYASKKGYGLRDKPRAHINGGSWGYGQKPPSSAAEKRSWKASEAPGQSWLEGKNFRPEPPSNPYLLVTVDGGHGAEPAKGAVTRPAGFDLEIRWPAVTHDYGEGEAA